MLHPDTQRHNPTPGDLRLVSIDEPAACGWFAAYIAALAEGRPRAAAAACQALHSLGLVVLVRPDAQGGGH